MISHPPDDPRTGSAVMAALVTIVAAAALLLMLVAMVRPVLLHLSDQVTRSEALIDERSEALR